MKVFRFLPLSHLENFSQELRTVRGTLSASSTGIRIGKLLHHLKKIPPCKRNCLQTGRTGTIKKLGLGEQSAAALPPPTGLQQLVIQPAVPGFLHFAGLLPLYRDRRGSNPVVPAGNTSCEELFLPLQGSNCQALALVSVQVSSRYCRKKRRQTGNTGSTSGFHTDSPVNWVSKRNLKSFKIMFAVSC